MKKILNIGYWVFTVALTLCGVFFLAVIYVPGEYIAPLLAKMHISYEWCIGLSTTSFATVCILVATNSIHNTKVRQLNQQNAKAFEAVKDANEQVQLMKDLFAKSIEKDNEVINNLKQLQATNSAILEMEKQTAKDRLAGGLMANKNKAELEKALSNVLEKEQEVAELKATSVVYETTVEKVVEVPKEQPSENDGLI